MNKLFITTILAAAILSSPAFAEEKKVEETPKIETLLAQNYQEITDWVKVAADKVGGFVTEQTPLVIQEYLSWVFFDNLFTIIIFCFFLVLSGCLMLFNIKKADFDKGNFNTVVFGVAALMFIFTLIGFLMEGTSAIKRCIKVKVAPRIVLIEKMKELSR